MIGLLLGPKTGIFPRKRLLNFDGMHGVTSQKTYHVTFGNIKFYVIIVSSVIGVNMSLTLWEEHR